MAARTQHSIGFVVATSTVLIGCSGPSARVQAGFFSGELSGNATLEAQTATANAPIRAAADVESGLGLSEPQGSIYLRLEGDSGPVRVTASALKYENAGTGRLDGDFGDITAGTNVSSSVELGVGKVEFTFDVLDLGVFRLSPGIGVDVFDLDASVTEQVTGQRERIDSLVAVPIVSVQSELRIGPASLVVDVGGMDARVDQYGGQFWDAEGMLLIEPVEHVEFFAGYRWLSIDANGEADGRDTTIDLELGGWFVGGGMRF